MAKIIILSGAGISAESGISTFRDAHEVVAKLKNKYPDDIAVITQNVDNKLIKVKHHNR